MNKNLRIITFNAAAAALYVALSFVFAPISFGAIQFRVSEALCILPLVSPISLVGLTLGCFISNCFSPFGIVDVIVGTSATLIAGLLMIWLKNCKIKDFPLLSFLSPVIINGLMVGAEISILSGDNFVAFLISFLYVALGEAGVVAILGVPLYFALKKTENKIF